jgi:hypothetical protein
MTSYSEVEQGRSKQAINRLLGNEYSADPNLETLHPAYLRRYLPNIRSRFPSSTVGVDRHATELRANAQTGGSLARDVNSPMSRQK